MYKCTDCGCEYEIKPEYCDCGNNVFTEIITEKPETKKTEIKETITPIKKVKKSNIDWIGLSVFFVCILLSILVILFLGNNILDKSNNATPKQVVTTKPSTNIPSINSFWQDTKIEVEPQVKVAEPVKVIPVTIPVVKTSNTKPVAQNKPKQATKPITQNTTQTTQKINVQKYLSNAQNPQQTQNTQQNTQKIVQTTQNTTVQKPAVNTASTQKELLSYKISLRNKIAQKIDFTRVVGDGSCKLTFKIDSSGRLIERKFTLQSANETLNDVVYSAMVQTPIYQTPPSAYKNEVLTLSIKIYGGNFEVDLR